MSNDVKIEENPENYDTVVKVQRLLSTFVESSQTTVEMVEVLNDLGEPKVGLFFKRNDEVVLKFSLSAEGLANILAMGTGMLEHMTTDFSKELDQHLTKEKKIEIYASYPEPEKSVRK